MRVVIDTSVIMSALMSQLDATLWTLDKKLQDHLIEKGFTKVVNTYELEQLFHGK